MQKIKYYLFITFWAIAATGIAQQVTTGKVKYDGIEYPAYIKRVDLSPDRAEIAVKEVFAEKGVKPRESKGYLVYRDVVLPAIDNYKMHDVFVKVEREGKKTDNRSKISVIITKPGEITDEKTPRVVKETAAKQVVLAGGGTQLFAEINPALDNQEYLKALMDQEDLVKKAERKLKDLEDSKARMEKQLTQLQADLEKNIAEMEKQAQEVEQLKAELESKKAAKQGN